MTQASKADARSALQSELRVAFAIWDDPVVYERTGWTDLDVPTRLGGHGRDIQAGALLAYELGWAARGAGWLDALTLWDVLADSPGQARRTTIDAALVGAHGVSSWWDGAVDLIDRRDRLDIQTTREHYALWSSATKVFVVPSIVDGCRHVLLVEVATDLATSTHRLASVRLHGASASRAALFATPDAAAWDGVVLRTMLRTTAWLLGLTGRALREAVGAGEDRIQFGVSVGSNQAIGFRLADLATRLVGARRLLWDSCQEPRNDIPLQYAQARSLAVEAATFGAHVSGARSMHRHDPAGGIRSLAVAMAGHPARTLVAADPHHVPRTAQAEKVPPVPAGTGDLLHETFYQQAARTPDHTAVVTPDDEFSYRELAARADALAAAVAARDLPPETFVAIAIPPNADFVATMIAVLRCALAFLPLPLTLPHERLKTLIQVAQPALIVTDRAHAALVEGLASDLLVVDQVGEMAWPAAGPSIHPDNLAYVLFTSGSTGRPKAAMISHRAVTSRLRWDWRHEPLGPSDVVLAHTSVGFDPFLWEVFGPLAAGATVYLADQAERSDLLRLPTLINQRGITALTALPSTVAEMLRLAPESLAAPSLRLLYCGGEQLPPALAGQLRQHCGAKLYNCYGLTETAIDATIGAVSADHNRDRPVPLGQPVPGAQVTVRHTDGRQVYPGVVGELCVAGDVLSRGYLGDPSGTAQRFRPDPLATTPGARVFHTGDSVRLVGQGNLEFVGRRDDELKVLGHRFYPIEVEAALRELDGVTDAVVGLAAGEIPRVVAAITLSGQAECRELRQQLRSRLPSALIPAQIRNLPRLPLLPTGKVDRITAVAAAAFVDPSGPGEPRTTSPAVDRARRLVARTLGLPSNHSLGGDFFALGGDSLRAVRIILDLRDTFGASVTLGALLEATNIRDWLKSVVPAPDPGEEL